MDKDTKYPVNEATVKKVIENYIKTSSSTFEPKQSDYSYYYSPQIGVVIPAPTGSTAIEIDEIAKANGSDYATINNGELIEWINLSINSGKPQTEWTYTNFATDTNNVYTGYTTNAKYFNVNCTTEDQNGNPVSNASYHVKISNSYHEAECNTPGTMYNVPAGNYALRVTDDSGWYYDFTVLIYREGMQKFTLDTPSGKVTFGSNSDETVAGNVPSTPDSPNNSTPDPCLHPNTEIRNRIEATTSADGYTGDTWCLICNTKIASGNTINKLPSSQIIEIEFGYMTKTGFFSAPSDTTWEELIQQNISITVYAYLTDMPTTLTPQISNGKIILNKMGEPCMPGVYTLVNPNDTFGSYTYYAFLNSTGELYGIPAQ